MYTHVQNSFQIFSFVEGMVDLVEQLEVLIHLPDFFFLFFDHC